MPLRVSTGLTVVGAAIGPLVIYAFIHASPGYAVLLPLLRTISPIGITPDLMLLALLYIGAMILAYLFLEAALIRRVERMLVWFRGVRARNFADPAPLPVGSGNALGQLERELASSVAWLWDTQKKLELLSKLKDEFITVASHQLRTPLTELSWGVEALMSAKEEKIAREQIANVLIGLKRMTQVVNNMIDVFATEEGTSRHIFESTDFLPAFAALIEEARLQAEHTALTLTFAKPDFLPRIRADKERLLLALSNIIGNAITYTPQGGKVVISAIAEEKHVRFTIEDTGLGIADEEKPRLFTKFTRGDDAKKMRPDGSGLGLYVAKNIVDAHKGTIEIESKRQIGTKVSITIPFA